jgi:hypothetical protein
MGPKKGQSEKMDNGRKEDEVRKQTMEEARGRKEDELSV